MGCTTASLSSFLACSRPEMSSHLTLGLSVKMSRVMAAPSSRNSPCRLAWSGEEGGKEEVGGERRGVRGDGTAWLETLC